jgi:hypothetical protein
MTLQTGNDNGAFAISYYCSRHVLILLHTVHKIYAIFQESTMAVCRFRPLGDIGNRKQRRRLTDRLWFLIKV